jgi:hypothetical protein
VTVGKVDKRGRGSDATWFLTGEEIESRTGEDVVAFAAEKR